MRILLHNFRSYVQTEYSFERGKITLVTGCSGAGKSTIFEAIDWCLYGKKRGIYNNQAPKDKCYVVLILPEMAIYRQGHPSLLRIVPFPTETLREKSFSDLIEYLTKQLPEESVDPSPAPTIQLSNSINPNLQNSLPETTLILPVSSLKSNIESLYYDGNTAQAMIDKQFGPRALWLPSSYMAQGTRCDLLSKSNTERMDILNSLSFLSEDPASYITF
jgi:energy-coupling factor transporter ATP-binding protein EcfA2